MVVDPAMDSVEADKRRVRPEPGRRVVALHKPSGVLSACRPGRENGMLVTELVRTGTRLFPVGRLDRESEGLLLLTNDGELALRLAHPRFMKEKEYQVLLDREPTQRQLARLRAGVRLSDGPSRPLRVRRTSPRTLRLVLAEGRRRQVRRMIAALGCRVDRLTRIRIAGLRLGGLKPGEWRELTWDEVEGKLLGKTPVDRRHAGQ